MEKEKKEDDVVVLDDENEIEDSGCCAGYPWWVAFILGNEFCERYAYYGMRSILVLYLTYFIGFSNNVSVEIYHAFAALCYFTPLFGAMLADSYWGKYKRNFATAK